MLFLGIVNSNVGVIVFFVNVIEKGILNGIIIDVDGNFILEVVNFLVILVFFFLGYEIIE